MEDPDFDVKFDLEGFRAMILYFAKDECYCEKNLV